MTIDENTLALTLEVTAFTLGTLLLVTWNQNKTNLALAFWAAAQWCAGLGIFVLNQGIQYKSSGIVALGIGAIILHYGLQWQGLRCFNGRRRSTVAVIAGPVCLVIAWSISTMGVSLFIASKAVAAAYSVAMVRELWPNRKERLSSQVAATSFLGIHAAFDICLTVLGLYSLMPQVQDSIREFIANDGYTLVHLEAYVLGLSSGVLLLSMTKERSEQRYAIAADHDYLTGIGNRRAFLRDASNLMESRSNQGEGYAIVLFDLDHFKLVNDTFGHRVGDQVLTVFARMLECSVRTQDRVARWGGEEFIALITNVNVRTALAITERIRTTTADCMDQEGTTLPGVTVSAGLAYTFGSTALETLLGAADQALYRAKANGRNRIEIADGRSASIR